MTISFLQQATRAPDMRATLVPNEFQDYDDIDELLADEVAQYYDDPLGWVMWAFDWDHGDLEGFDGPDEWQRDFLIELGRQIKQKRFNGVDPVDPNRFSFASGHGIGKSAVSSWLILFIMSTRPYAKGIVTANTGEQLHTKTWAELGKWRERCLVGHWFEYNNGKGSMSLYHKSFASSWRVDAQTCREENSEAFAGLHAANSTPFYLFDEACHDHQTEVMTIEGWKLFKDIKPQDMLLTMDTNTREAYYDVPTHIHSSEYKGYLKATDIRGCSFAVTPNHRMLFESRKVKPFQFQDAGGMCWSNKKMMRHVNWRGAEVDTFTVPEYNSRRVTYPPITVKMNDWLELLGWFVSEGHVTTQQWVNKDGVISQEYTATVITQKQEHYTDEIEACVKRMQVPYTRRSTGIWINSVAIAAHLTDAIGKGFDGKRVPSWMYQLTPKLIRVFLDAAVKGDGYKKGNGDILYTSSANLAEDYNRLALMAGANSTINKRVLEGQTNWVVDHYATSSCDGYVVSIRYSPTYIDCGKARPTDTWYEGMVYCATVSGGVLYTRRNGHTLWSGNSAVPAKIWEVAEGGLTDGEPMFFCFGNPTRNDGKFHATFNPSSRWTTKQIDSRSAKMTNKRVINQWIQDYGDDSDFVRVRVKGQFPKAGDMQFIGSDTVEDAQTLPLPVYLGDEPLVMSLDVARGGGDDCRISFRRGKDLKSESSYRITYEHSRDSMKMLGKVVMVIERHKPNAIFVDSTGVGGPIHDRLKELGYNSYEVHFGNKADDEKRYYNKTAEMGDRLRKALLGGARLPQDEQLKRELTCREFWHDEKDRLVLERKKDVKKRLGYSPDWADSLYLLYSMENIPRLHYKRGDADIAPWAREARTSKSLDYDPLADM